MNISIKKPCHEDWSKMTPNEKGAFCKVCTKDVIDFTKKSLDEIKEYFSKPKEGSTCGQFQNEQLLELGFDSFFDRFSGFKLSRKVALVIAVSFMSWLFGSTELSAQNDERKKGMVAVVREPVTTQKDTTKTNGKQPEIQPKGEVSVEPKPECKDPKNKTKSKNKSKATTRANSGTKKEKFVLMGDVDVSK